MSGPIDASILHWNQLCPCLSPALSLAGISPFGVRSRSDARVICHRQRGHVAAGQDSHLADDAITMTQQQNGMLASLSDFIGLLYKLPPTVTEAKDTLLLSANSAGRFNFFQNWGVSDRCQCQGHASQADIRHLACFQPRSHGSCCCRAGCVGCGDSHTSAGQRHTYPGSDLWASLQRTGVHGKMLAAIQSLSSGGAMSMNICGRAGATGPGWGEARMPPESHAVWPFL